MRTTISPESVGTAAAQLMTPMVDSRLLTRQYLTGGRTIPNQSSIGGVGHMDSLR